MKHLIDRLQIAQGNNNVDELIPEVIEMLRKINLYEIKEHYCLAYEDIQGKLKIAETYPPPEGSIKLYTHPAKTLTDFEIRGVMALDECWIGEDCSTPNMIAFARAILRKAQEK